MFLVYLRWERTILLCEFYVTKIELVFVYCSEMNVVITDSSWSWYLLANLLDVTGLLTLRLLTFLCFCISLAFMICLVPF